MNVVTEVAIKRFHETSARLKAGEENFRVGSVGDKRDAIEYLQQVLEKEERKKQEVEDAANAALNMAKSWEVFADKYIVLLENVEEINRD